MSGVTFTKGDNLITYGFNVNEEHLLGVNSALLDKTLLPFDEETLEYLNGLKTVPVASISLSKTTTSLSVGESELLIATVLPEDANNKTVKFTSANASVASVDPNGRVTANAGGTAIITANASGKTATCSVTVTVPVSGVTLNKTETSLNIGGEEVLVATVLPSNASNKSVSFTSSEQSVVTVDSSGKVVAVGEGNATITVTASGKTATCMVTVNTEEIV
ncbi:Ig-like domain-containing protein [Cytobacillus horneckiae]|uniref:Ig domain-containing protein n=1 Tax=Cytobacillus horneckiae TaxID=549687 RepID=UPI0034CEB9FF